MKSTILTLFLLFSLCSNAFHSVLHISVTPSDSKIYVDNVLKGVGNISITLSQAKEIQIKVEKDGYVTHTDYYAYDVPKGSSSRKSYNRGDNYIVVELVKNGTDENHNAKKETTNEKIVAESSPLLNEKAGMAKVIIIDGKFVFTNCEPILPYETAFEFSTKIVTLSGCPSMQDIAESAVKSANKKGFPFDAVIIGKGKLELAIKFK